MLDRQALIAAAARQAEGGPRLKYLTFWSHEPKRPGAPPAAECLSQWHPSSFELDGVRYATAEHFMMAEKARLFGDTAALARVLSASSPGAAKAAGRAVEGFDEAAWAAAREGVVVRGCLAKFRSHPELEAFLRNTGARVLVEASPRDAVWGCGLAADHPDIEAPARWPGLNLLGFCLMRARVELMAS